jgi:hypothetical protein
MVRGKERAAVKRPLVDKIAKLFGVHPATANGWLKRKNMPMVYIVRMIKKEKAEA